jgi:hypothetical protein
LFDTAIKMKGQISDMMLYTYMNLKRKKMNFSMMVLADCISIEGHLPEKLLEYINEVGEVCELRACAYKDLASGAKKNNLYNFWHLWKKGEEAGE